MPNQHSDSLFHQLDPQNMPLAARMRPRTLDELVGQEAVVGPRSLLRKALESDAPPSLILCGPAGCGKSTLAMIIAGMTKHHFEPLSAVTAGVADIRKAATDATERQAIQSRRTLVFIDEIHRLNKSQQDSLLPHVEQGTFTLIGATTENPYFSIITPLRSRCRLYALQPLTTEGLRDLLLRALADEERGLGKMRVEMDEEALTHLAEGSGGDARTALSALEMAVVTAPEVEGVRAVTLAVAEEALQRPVLKYDRGGDEHYDTISAFIKSMRGSDPDAAIYWLAKMLEAGEDARFIARRIVIQAAEDVGLADPTALRVAIAAADAVECVGLPEAQIPLAMAVIHLATAPKSNSAYQAIKQARKDVAKEGSAKVPAHLANVPEPGQENKAKYLYPHDYPGGYVSQDYLPPGLLGRRYYTPGENRREQAIAEHLARLRGEMAEGE
ncbi:MAG: replication-associated recombination protein A [Armatimonadota bacterium]